jgi:hypothetical protein
MRLFAASVLMLTSSLAFAQVPHITQPFFHLWDYPTVNVTLTPGFTQVAHFELQIDALTPVSTIPPVPISVPAATAGYLTFKVAADPALAMGPHTFNIWACPTLVAAAGCVGSTPGPFAFVLDPKPLPSAQRLGVGL